MRNLRVVRRTENLGHRDRPERFDLARIPQPEGVVVHDARYDLIVNKFITSKVLQRGHGKKKKLIQS